ncbi:unnamed protein product [Symbiodinium necroappetens]|uniref:WW domain-containing protein n=1 Tax=Symbiodinium necroappetens TaxID=1628268 RepID=A0A812RYJ5_9DINO|nr:unnamed protein product [Symbiodinium necroappetens]
MEVIDDADVCSSGSEAVVVEEENQEHAKEHASKNADQKSSRHKRDALREKSRQKRVHAQLEAKLQTMPLPPGWVRVASKSKPGAFYYAHPATKRTQAHPPATMYEGLPEPSKVLTPVRDIVQDAADAARKAEAKKKEREAEDGRLGRVDLAVLISWSYLAEEKARLAAKEEAARMRRKRDEEAAADEEVIRKAREKRALAPKESFEEAQAPERKEKRKATGVRFDTAKGAQDENGSPLAGSDSEELDLYRLRDQFRAKVAATSAPVFDDLEEAGLGRWVGGVVHGWFAGKKALDRGCLEEAEEGCNGGCLDGGNCVEEERKQFKKLKKSLFQMIFTCRCRGRKPSRSQRSHDVPPV